MVDTMSVQQPPKFSTIVYETKDGEKISATKKDGVVTLVGDKNGVRQMEIEKFLKEELTNNAVNINLENSPAQDTFVKAQAPSSTVEASKTITEVKPESPTKALAEVKTSDVKPAEKPVVNEPEEKHTVSVPVTNPISPDVKAFPTEVKKLDIMA